MPGDDQANERAISVPEVFDPLSADLENVRNTAPLLPGQADVAPLAARDAVEARDPDRQGAKDRAQEEGRQLPRRAIEHLRTATEVALEAGKGALRGFTERLLPDEGGPGDADAAAKRQAKPDPVDPATGEFVLHRVDLELSGIGLPLSLERVYRSRVTYDGPLGFNWMASWDEELFEGATDCGDIYYLWKTGRGSTIRFQQSPSGTFVSEPASPYQLKKLLQAVEVIEPNGTHHHFVQGNLLEVRDVHGNAITYVRAPADGQSGPPQAPGAGGYRGSPRPAPLQRRPRHGDRRAVGRSAPRLPI